MKKKREKAGKKEASSKKHYKRPMLRRMDVKIGIVGFTSTNPPPSML